MKLSSYETIRFPSRQADISLSGWYLEVNPNYPVVIVTYGMGDGKGDANVLIASGMLEHNGFNVLLYDLRNFGDSDKDNGHTGAGNKEYQDVLGAWDYLINVKGYRPEPNWFVWYFNGRSSHFNRFWTGASRRGCLC